MSGEIPADVQRTITTVESMTDGSYLKTQEAERYVDRVFQLSRLNADIGVQEVRFRHESMKIAKISTAGHVMVPKSEGVDPGVRKKVRTSHITLSPVTTQIPWEVSYEVIQRALRGPGGEDIASMVSNMFAKHGANDAEGMALNGHVGGHLARNVDLDPDLANPDQVRINGLYALQNGLIRQLELGGVRRNMGGAELSFRTFTTAQRALPVHQQQDFDELVWLVSPNTYSSWLERLSTRGTASADAAMGGAPLAPLGIRLIRMPLLPDHPQRTVTGSFGEAGGTITLPHRRIWPGIPPVVARQVDVAGGGSIEPFEAINDYTIDYATGVLTHVADGEIDPADVLRITYRSPPVMILTKGMNIIHARSLEVGLEMDRDIYRGVLQYALTQDMEYVFQDPDYSVLVDDFSLPFE